MLIANWKMHGTRAKVRAYAYAVNAALASSPAGLKVVFCPPALYLESAELSLPLNTQLALGAQNCHAQAEGAFTGEMSAAMLAEIGVEYVILGHSERRTLQGETDQLVFEKAQAVAAQGLIPVVCIGESAEEYAANKTADILAKQLQSFKQSPVTKLIIAYEPIWAIGTGKTPNSTEIAAAHGQIKSLLGSATPVLYGGSVKPANIAEILAIDGVDGALIGGASLEVESMRAMIAAVK